MRRPAFVFIVSASAVLLPGCPPADPEPEPYVQRAPWEALSPGERDEFMEARFSPVMKALFQEFDPDMYGAFACATCHGADAEAMAYAMPADVAAIGLSDIPVDEIEDPERREVGIWMDEVILPEMGRMFEQEITLEGSSCLDCHPFDATLPGG